MVEQILKKITAELSALECVEAVVLGGSRASGTATDTSDIDIGIYYKKDRLDYGQLNHAAQRLDDEHRPGLICREGQWGDWVNCGAWLVIDGYPVDLILRDKKRVEDIVEQTDRGEIGTFYQTGHPHGYQNVMYRGELAACKVLYAEKEAFYRLKQHAEEYPESLREALLHFFGFEAGFSSMFVDKSVQTGDTYYMAGHIFRAVSAMNQVLFALNRMWCLNEKKAVFRIETFAVKPDGYRQKVEEIFRNVGADNRAAADQLRALTKEVEEVRKHACHLPGEGV